MDANALFEMALDQGIWAVAFVTVAFFVFTFFKATIEDLKKFQDRTLQKSEEREERLMAVIESYSDNFEVIKSTQGRMQEDIKDLKEVIIGK